MTHKDVYDKLFADGAPPTTATLIADMYTRIRDMEARVTVVERRQEADWGKVNRDGTIDRDR